MLTKDYLDGNDILSLTIAGTKWLEKVVPEINAMNVYPVPDGDCGTNMFLTLSASIEEASKLPDTSQTSAVATAIAKGALMGARGNSGVILSQIWRGFAEALKEKSAISAADLAHALQRAADVAYKALSNPVEGTILTVIKDAAKAAISRASTTDPSPISVLEAAVLAARESVVNTPNLLEELREAGVLDAGGHGLYTFLEGALLSIKGGLDHQSPLLLSTQLPRIIQSTETPTEEAYGYCTQFIIKDCRTGLEKVQTALESLGTSLLVVGEPATTRVHIHTLEPQKVLDTASKFGELTNIDINNMDEQHQSFLLLHREKMSAFDCVVVAITTSKGLSKIFSDLGAAAVIQQEQVTELTALEILRIIDQLPADKIILLPNHRQMLETALNVPSLTKKQVAVVPTKSIPQGIAAMIAFVPESPFETNVTEMLQALSDVHTIEVTSSMTGDKHASKTGRITGWLDGEKETKGDSFEEVVLDLLNSADICQASLLTIYRGKAITETEANLLKSQIAARYPHLDIEVVNSGQTDYDYIISVE